MVCAVMAFRPRLLVFFQVFFVSVILLSVMIAFGYTISPENSFPVVLVTSYAFIKHAKNNITNYNYTIVDHNKISFWRRKPVKFRKKVFISIAWFLFCLLVFNVFDPFEFYGWDPDEFLQFFIVALLPVFWFLLASLYRRFVTYDE